MLIGTVRVEEAKVFDSDSGYHQFENEAGEKHGSFEVFWHDGQLTDYEDDDIDNPSPAGWYWRACFPGCMPDGDPCGPFASSSRAKHDALGI